MGKYYIPGQGGSPTGRGGDSSGGYVGGKYYVPSRATEQPAEEEDRGLLRTAFEDYLKPAWEFATSPIPAVQASAEQDVAALTEGQTDRPLWFEPGEGFLSPTTRGALRGAAAGAISALPGLVTPLDLATLPFGAATKAAGGPLKAAQALTNVERAVQAAGGVGLGIEGVTGAVEAAREGDLSTPEQALKTAAGVGGGIFRAGMGGLMLGTLPPRLEAPPVPKPEVQPREPLQLGPGVYESPATWTPIAGLLEAPPPPAAPRVVDMEDIEGVWQFANELPSAYPPVAGLLPPPPPRQLPPAVGFQMPGALPMEGLPIPTGARGEVPLEAPPLPPPGAAGGPSGGPPPIQLPPAPSVPPAAPQAPPLAAAPPGTPAGLTEEDIGRLAEAIVADQRAAAPRLATAPQGTPEAAIPLGTLAERASRYEEAIPSDFDQESARGFFRQDTISGLDTLHRIAKEEGAEIRQHGHGIESWTTTPKTFEEGGYAGGQNFVLRDAGGAVQAGAFIAADGRVMDLASVEGGTAAAGRLIYTLIKEVPDLRVPNVISPDTRRLVSRVLAKAEVPIERVQQWVAQGIDTVPLRDIIATGRKGYDITGRAGRRATAEGGRVGGGVSGEGGRGLGEPSGAVGPPAVEGGGPPRPLEAAPGAGRGGLEAAPIRPYDPEIAEDLARRTEQERADWLRQSEDLAARTEAERTDWLQQSEDLQARTDAERAAWLQETEDLQARVDAERASLDDLYEGGGLQPAPTAGRTGTLFEDVAPTRLPGVETRGARQIPPPVRERLVARGDAALQRLRERGQSGEAFDLGRAVKEGGAALADLIEYGASRVAVHGLDFAKWSADMVAKFGEAIKPELKKLWDQARGYVEMHGGQVFVPGRAAPSMAVRGAAERYMKSKGIPDYDPNTRKVADVNVEQGKATADAFTAMKHDPNRPEVKASYVAMKRDIQDQYDYLVDEEGYHLEPWTKEGQPYKDSRETHRDVNQNKHLSFFTGGDLPADHPLAARAPNGLTYNDMFRAVHDVFAHAKEGFEFGPRGEENAWREHYRMFSPEARPAMTTETRGQNSWVNFGQHLRTPWGDIPKKGEEGYIPPAERPYAEQKAGLLPDEFNRLEEEVGVPEFERLNPEKVRKNIVYHTKAVASAAKGEGPNFQAPVHAPQIAPKKGPDGKDFIWGKVTPSAWLKRAQTYLDPEEWRIARNWYRDLRGKFVEHYGEAEADRRLLAWGLSQQRASPSVGLRSSERAFEKARGVNIEAKAGLGEARLIAAAKGEMPTSGIGQKLADFMDSIHQQAKRLWTGRQGDLQPAAVDVWAGRDLGFVDKTMADFIEAATGKRPQADMKAAAPADAQYEYGLHYYNELAKWLNSKGVDGGGWTAPEAQAVGWTAIQKMVGAKPESVADVFAKNMRTAAIEVAPGEGTPRATKYPALESLPREKGAEISRYVGERLVQEAATLVNARVVGVHHGNGPWGKGVSPNIVPELLGSPEAIEDFTHVVGYAAQQTTTMSMRVVKGGAGTKPGLSVGVKRGALDFSNPEDVRSVWEKFVAVAPDIAEQVGATAVPVKDGGWVLRIFPGDPAVSGGAWTSLRNRVVKGLDQATGRDADLQVKYIRAELFTSHNDWSVDSGGSGHRRGIERRRPGIVGELDRLSSRTDQWYEEAFQRYAPDEYRAHRGEPAQPESVESLFAKLDEAPPQDLGWLEKAASEAAERMRSRARSTMAAGVDPTAIPDLALVGANWMVKGLRSVGEFTARLVREFGDWAAGLAGRVWEEAGRLLQGVVGGRGAGAQVAAAAQPGPGAAGPAGAAGPPPGPRPPAGERPIPPRPAQPTGFTPPAGGPRRAEVRAAVEAGKGEGGRTTGKPPEEPINYDRIGSADDVKEMESRIADSLRESLKEARSYRSWKEAEKKAVAAGLTEKDFNRIVREKGALTDVDIEAGRRLRETAFEDAHRKLQEAQRLKAAGDELGALQADQDYAAAVAKAAGVMWSTVRAGAEAGRALAIHAKLSQGLTLEERMAKKLFKEMPALSKRLQEKVAKAAVEKDHAGLVEALREAYKPDFLDKFIEYWKGGLISGPPTLGGNVIGNTAHEVLRTGERGVGAVVEKLGVRQALERWLSPGRVATEDTRELGEAAAAFGALWKTKFGWGRGMRAMWDATLTERARLPESGEFEHHLPAIGGRLGKIIRTPFRWLEAWDAAAAHSAGQGALAAQAFRQATVEVRGGRIAKDAFDGRISELMEKVGDWRMVEAKTRLDPKGLTRDEQATLRDPLLRRIGERMMAEERRSTFRDPAGQLTRKVNAARNDNRALHFILPFTTTVSRIMAAAVSRTPYGFWQVFRDIRSGKIKGGDISDELSKPIMGMLLMGGFVTAANEGFITGSGPGDNKERAQLEKTGWKSYSVKIGDRYYSYKRLEPMATLMALAADAVESKGAQDQSELIEKLHAAIVNGFTDKTYLQGLVDFSEFYADPLRYYKTYLKNFEGSLVPNIVARGAQAIDPLMRETEALETTYGVPEPIAARLPGLSTTLEARRGVSGEEVERPGGAVERFLSPFPSSEEKKGAGPDAEREILRVGAIIGQPQKKLRVRGAGEIELDEREYNLMQDTYQDAFKRVQRLIRSSYYRNLPDTEEETLPGQSSKEGEIRKLYNQARSRGRARLYQDPRFRRRAALLAKQRRAEARERRA